MDIGLIVAPLIFLVVFDLLAYRYGVDSRETLEARCPPETSRTLDRLASIVDGDLARQLHEHRRHL